MKYFLLIVLLFKGMYIANAQTQTIPHLQKQGTATQLIVDGKPYLILGGELLNSSASNMNYMKPIWPKMVQGNLNTVLATVSWELMEPQEGKFDFALVDGLIDDARKHKLRLILLWFGSWKNTVSTYVPTWVKTDFKRFPRIKSKDGSAQERLSTLSDANCEADKKAFVALMRHLREKDGMQRTVIMVQVENEVGMYPDSRDRSVIADEVFAKPVPKEITDYMTSHIESLNPIFKKAWLDAGSKTSGNWEELFGKGRLADDFFMSWTFAVYINKIAQAGKKEYSLPLFVNTALNSLSGGPQDKVMDIWKAIAPGIDFLTPDIYSPLFTEFAARYQRSDNPLFIPEARMENMVAAKGMYAFGQHDAMGFSPFGIDGIENMPKHPIAKVYGVLSQLSPLILKSQGMRKMGGILLDSVHPTQELTLGNYKFSVSFGKKKADTNPPYAYGIVIATGENEFIIAGSSLYITFKPINPGPAQVGLKTVSEGSFVGGKWLETRRLNGDEIDDGRHLYLPSDEKGISIQSFSLYRYE